MVREALFLDQMPPTVSIPIEVIPQVVDAPLPAADWQAAGVPEEPQSPLETLHSSGYVHSEAAKSMSFETVAKLGKCAAVNLWIEKYGTEGARERFDETHATGILDKVGRVEKPAEDSFFAPPPKRNPEPSKANPPESPKTTAQETSKNAPTHTERIQTAVIEPAGPRLQNEISGVVDVLAIDSATSIFEEGSAPSRGHIAEFGLQTIGPEGQYAEKIISVTTPTIPELQALAKAEAEAWLVSEVEKEVNGSSESLPLPDEVVESPMTMEVLQSSAPSELFLDLAVGEIPQATEVEQGGWTAKGEIPPLILFDRFVDAVTEFVSEAPLPNPLSEGMDREASYGLAEAQEFPAQIATEVATKLTELTAQQKEVAMPIVQNLTESLQSIRRLQMDAAATPKEIVAAVEQMRRQIVQLFEATGMEYDDQKVEYFIQAMLDPSFVVRQQAFLTPEELAKMGTREVKLSEQFAAFLSHSIDDDQPPTSHRLGRLVVFITHPSLALHLWATAHDTALTPT